MLIITSADQLRRALEELHDEAERLKKVINAHIENWDGDELNELMPDQLTAALIGKGMTRAGAETVRQDVRGGLASITRSLKEASIRLSVVLSTTATTSLVVRKASQQAHNLEPSGFTV